MKWLFAYFLLIHCLQFVASQNSCPNRPPTKVQVAFVVDRTNTFVPHLKKLGNGIIDFMEELQRQFPGSQVAFTTFGDYSTSQREKPKRKRDAAFNRTYNNDNWCYAMEQRFTEDSTAVRQTISEIPGSYGNFDWAENSITALMFAAADKNIGWIDGDTGKPLQKIVFLVTDNDAIIGLETKFIDGAKRRPAKGDGTDTCINSLIPDFAVIRRLFRQKKIKIVAALAQHDKTPKNVFQAYTGYLNEIEAQHILMDFDDSNTRAMVASWMNAVNQMVPCKPVDVKMDCKAEGQTGARVPARIQLSFVMDRTSSFTKKFFNSFADISEEMSNRLNQKYPGSDFSLAVFTDYTSRQWKHNMPRPELQNDKYSDRESCYSLEQPFTKDIKKFQAATRNVRLEHKSGGDETENQLSAIYFAALDKKMGWYNSPNDKTQLVHKIIALVTDTDTHDYSEGRDKSGKFLDAGNRKSPRGDGSDTCENSFFPDYNDIAKVLRANDISIIGLLAAWEDYYIFRRWSKHFNKIGIPFTLAELDISKVDSVLDPLIKSIDRIVPCEMCTPGDPRCEKVKPPVPPPPISPPPPTPAPQKPIPPPAPAPPPTPENPGGQWGNCKFGDPNCFGPGGPCKKTDKWCYGQGGNCIPSDPYCYGPNGPCKFGDPYCYGPGGGSNCRPTDTNCYGPTGPCKPTDFYCFGNGGNCRPGQPYCYGQSGPCKAGDRYCYGPGSNCANGNQVCYGPGGWCKPQDYFCFGGPPQGNCKAGMPNCFGAGGICAVWDQVCYGPGVNCRPGDPLCFGGTGTCKPTDKICFGPAGNCIFGDQYCYGPSGACTIGDPVCYGQIGNCFPGFPNCFGPKGVCKVGDPICFQSVGSGSTCKPTDIVCYGPKGYCNVGEPNCHGPGENCKAWDPNCNQDWSGGKGNTNIGSIINSTVIIGSNNNNTNNNSNNTGSFNKENSDNNNKNNNGNNNGNNNDNNNNNTNYNGKNENSFNIYNITHINTGSTNIVINNNKDSHDVTNNTTIIIGGNNITNINYPPNNRNEETSPPLWGPAKTGVPESPRSPEGAPSPPPTPPSPPSPPPIVPTTPSTTPKPACGAKGGPECVCGDDDFTCPDPDEDDEWDPPSYNTLGF